MIKTFGWPLAVTAVTVFVIALCVSYYYREQLLKFEDYEIGWFLSFDKSLGRLFQIQEKCRLVIGILSSRGNGARRRHIRRTWLSENYGPDVCIRFVVGSDECPVPPEDKLDIYGCQPWLVENPKPGTHFLASIDYDSTTSDFVQGLNVGIRFKVRHPIVVDKLGISTDVLLQNEAISVVFIATASQEIVAEVSFSSEQPGSIHDGYSYRPVEPFLLPKDYEATIVCATPTSNESIKWNVSHRLSVIFDLGGNVIDLHQIFDTDGLTHGEITNGRLGVSLAYTIYDLESLRSHVMSAESRLNQWKRLSEERIEVLKKEVSTYRDVVLVEAVDTYRNLPHKLLLFYSWVAQHHTGADHVIKMDDDSVINVRRILDLLGTKHQLFKQTNLWWGSFRQHWSVQQHGKWLEKDYRSVSYPPFACGVASLLTTDIVRWLAKNREHLHLFQGEDTSMGIWLAALGPKIIEDDRWQCDDSCEPDSLSRGQLDEDGLYESWISLQTCGQLCHCPNTNEIAETKI